jgi:hypothetical protein
MKNIATIIFEANTTLIGAGFTEMGKMLTMMSGFVMPCTASDADHITT